MSKTQIIAAGVAICCCCLLLGSGVEQVPSINASSTSQSALPLLIDPDSSVQTRLRAVEACMDKDPVECYREIHALVDDTLTLYAGALKRGARPHEPLTELIRQFAFYMTDSSKVSPNPTFYRKFTYRAGISREELVGVLAPFADSPDHILQYWVTEHVLGGVDLERCDRPEFIPIAIYGLKHKNDFSPTLIDVMYRQNERLAVSDLEDFLGVNQDEVRNISFAMHAVDEVLFYKHWNELRQPVVDEAVARLKVLLISPKWWIRRYVAEVVWRYDTFRNSQIGNDVQRDPDARVSAAATRPDSVWMESERREINFLRSLKGASH